MTEHIPEFEIPKMVPQKELEDYIPSMKDLSEPETLDGALDKLEGLLDRNESWISSADAALKHDINAGIIDKESKIMTSAVAENVSRARKSLERMRSGIKTLRTDKMVREAFMLANRAIKISQEGPTGLGEGEFKWFPSKSHFSF